MNGQGWVAPKHICSSARARVLALKLEACVSVKAHTWVAIFPSSCFVPAGSASQELGYLCEFSDADLLVSLPLKFLSSSLCVFMLFFGCAAARWNYVNARQFLFALWSATMVMSPRGGNK